MGAPVVMNTPGELSLELDNFDGQLEPRHFSASDRISSLFEVHLEAVSADPDIDFDRIVGHPACFTIHPSSSERRSWSGVCSAMDQVAAPIADGLTTYALTIVPLMWLCTQRSNRRIFQRMSDPDIVCALLDEWEIPYQRRLSDDSYRRREFRVQYGESDFSFMTRLLQECGISFHFDNASKVVLCNAPQANTPREPLPFVSEGLDRKQPHVGRARLQRQVKPGIITFVDHDALRADEFRLSGQAGIAGDSHEAKLERFHYTPGAFLFEDGSASGRPMPVADGRGRFRRLEEEGQRAAQRYLAATRAASTRILLSSNALDLRPGTVMSIDGHAHDWLHEDRRLLVLASTVSGAHDMPCALQCEAVDAGRPYAPPITEPKPRTYGVETAVVVGPPGEEIHTNELGQVRVHFHWDRESRMDDDSSCWLHVSQPWAGTGFGSTSLPRVGQQVLVDFLGGDPDHPIVVGRLYTGNNRGPYALPEHKTRSGWRSASSPGGDGYNELMFEDAAGAELLSMHAQRDMATRVNKDLSVSVGGDEQRIVSSNASLSVKHDHDVRVGGAHRLDVSSALTESIGQASTELVGAAKTIQAAGQAGRRCRQACQRRPDGRQPRATRRRGRTRRLLARLGRHAAAPHHGAPA